MNLKIIFYMILNIEKYIFYLKIGRYTFLNVIYDFSPIKPTCSFNWEAEGIFKILNIDYSKI